MRSKLKKENSKLKSIRGRLFITVTLTSAIIILALIVLNSLVLKSFYLYSKIKDVKATYKKINNMYNYVYISYESIANIALKNNIDIIIENEQGVLEFSSNNEIANTLNKEWAYNTKKKRTFIFSDNNISINTVTYSGVKYILLYGKLDNGKKLYIQVPIAAIEESVRVSNNLLIIMGVATLIISSLIAAIISKNFTNPILKLNEITKKMANLDFDEKYELTEAEDELNELGHNINIMSEKLEKTIKQLRNNNNQLEKDIEEKSKIDEMRKQFISDVSHELKTPIALIQGYSEGLLEDVNSDEESRKRYAEIILDETNKMDKLVKQLLELMKIEYGKMEFNDGKFDICELIKEVIRRCKMMSDEKKTSINFKEAEPIYVYADEFYIEQAFTNYVTNAIKHVKEVNQEKYIEVTIEVNRERNVVRVNVFNTGDNIEEEYIDKIWGRFYKKDESRNRNDGGTGIGLALVKAIMANYNSKYGIINKRNGVEFYFEIKLAD